MNNSNANGRKDFTAMSSGGPENGAQDEAYYPSKLQASDLGIAQIRRAIIERRWLILAAMAIGLGIALAISLLTTPLYRASTLLEINPPEVEILDGASTVTQPNQSAFLETQYGLLESEALAIRVARELNLAADPNYANPDASREARLLQATQKLRNGLNVAPENGSQLVRVNFVSPEPAQAAKIANSFAENFIKTNLERGYDANSFARNFLQEQLATVKEELEDSERALNTFAQQSGIVTSAGTGQDGGGEKVSLEDQSLAALNTALTNARIARVTAEQNYRQAQNAGPGSRVVQSTSGLRQERSKLQAEYDQKLAVFRPDYPEMRELQSKIDSLDKLIVQETRNLTGGDENTLRAAYLSAQQAEQELEQRVNQLKGTVLAQRNQSIESNILQREVDTNRALYDALLQRYKEIGVTGGVGKSPVSLVDRARPPSKPFRPNIPLNLIVGLLAGLVIGLLLAIVFELIFDTIKMPDDVRNRLGLRLIGVIPEADEDMEPVAALEDPKSSMSEAYASARTAIQFIREGGGPQVISLTSTRPAEGKSTSAYGLARSFARVGKRTLLIDADMRRPTFESERGRDGGLMKLLTSEDALLDHTQQSGVENLSLLAAGRGPNNAAELLASSRLQAVIAEARRDFDIVIIDGPPVIGLADAPLLSAASDATVVVVESGGARIGATNETLNRLRASQAPIAGVLLVKFPAKLSDGDYYYYYDYSYGTTQAANAEGRRIAIARDGD